MIHPTRLQTGRPPTVAELIVELQHHPQDALVVGIIQHLVVAPNLQQKFIYSDQRGHFHQHRIDAEGATKSVRAVVL